MDMKKLTGYVLVALIAATIAFQAGSLKSVGSNVLGGSTKSSWNISDNLTVGGNSTLTGTLAYKELTGTNTATTTLSLIDSGKTFYISGDYGTITLPTSTTAGTNYRFVIGGSATGNKFVVTNGSSNIINGTLIVAGAVVDCDAEDTITFVADGENVGDFFDIRSDGTNWILGASGALTASKLTCTAT